MMLHCPAPLMAASQPFGRFTMLPSAPMACIANVWLELGVIVTGAGVIEIDWMGLVVTTMETSWLNCRLALPALRVQRPGFRGALTVMPVFDTPWVVQAPAVIAQLKSAGTDPPVAVTMKLAVFPIGMLAVSGVTASVTLLTVMAASFEVTLPTEAFRLAVQLE